MAGAASGGGESTSRDGVNRAYVPATGSRKLCAQFGAPVNASAWKVRALDPMVPQVTALLDGARELHTTQLLIIVAPVAVFSSTLLYLKTQPGPSRVAPVPPVIPLEVAPRAVT